MKLKDLITPELLNQSIHPGRPMTDEDIRESKALVEENKHLIEVFAHCHETCSGTEGYELRHDNAIAGATVVALDRAIRQATADSSPEA